MSKFLKKLKKAIAGCTLIGAATEIRSFELRKILPTNTTTCFPFYEVSVPQEHHRQVRPHTTRSGL